MEDKNKCASDVPEAARTGTGEGAQARGAKSFNAWKTYAMSFLISLSQHTDKQNVVHFIDKIITYLRYARTRDLPRILSDLYLLSKEIPEVTQIIPSVSDVSRWLGGEEE